MTQSNMADIKRDLKSFARDTILTEVIGKRAVGSAHGGRVQWKVLIVDDVTLKIVSSCLTMAQLASEGVSSVEHIHKHREPNGSAEAIFFVPPKMSNVKAILDDIKYKYYKTFDIMFTESCPQPTLDVLTSKVTRPYLIKSCKQVYLSFIPVEKHVFSMSMKSILPPIDESTMNHPDGGINGYASKCMDEMAEQLATLCYTLGGQPTLWYQNGCSYTQPFAHKLRERLIDMKTSEVKNTAPNQTADTKITQYPVLILDRGFDLISCLVHDMYYQAVAYDVLGGDKIEVEKQTYNHTKDNGEISSHQLDDTDSIWEKYKHTHVAEVFNAFGEKAKDAKKKQDAKNAEDGKTNMKQLKRDVQELTKDKKYRNELAVNVGIAHNLKGKIEYNNILKICEVEEELVTKGIMSKITF